MLVHTVRAQSLSRNTYAIEHQFHRRRLPALHGNLRLLWPLPESSKVSCVAAEARRATPAFGFVVRVRTADAGLAPSLGSPGMFGWEGIASTCVSTQRSTCCRLGCCSTRSSNEDHIFARFANAAYQVLEHERGGGSFSFQF